MLRNKNIFVTGGSRGIGSSTVLRCVELGAAVGFSYLSGEKEALETVSLCGGGRCHAYKGDTSDIDRMKEVASEFCGKVSGLDGLVINAGIYNRSSFRDLDIEGWRKTHAVNLDGAFFALKAFLPHMDSGSVVMMSSQLAFKGSGHGSDYASSKAGILGLARSLAKDLAPAIRVNSIAPGYVDTDLLAGDTPEKRRQRIEEVPLKRMGKPSDIANVAAFLLSDMSSYVNGACIDVNGGLFIH